MTPDPHTVAVDWVAKRDAGLTAGEREQLRAWLAAHPRHAAAFAAADSARTELDWPLHAGAAEEIIGGLKQRAARRRRRRVSAAIVGSVAALVLVIATMRRADPANSPAIAAASNLIVKSPLRQILPDGSAVELKEGARIAS